MNPLILPILTGLVLLSSMMAFTGCKRQQQQTISINYDDEALWQDSVDQWNRDQTNAPHRTWPRPPLDGSFEVVGMTNLTILRLRGSKEWPQETIIPSEYSEAVRKLFPTNTWTNQTIAIMKWNLEVK